MLNLSARHILLWVAALLALSLSVASCGGLGQKDAVSPPSVMVEEGKEYLSQQGEDVFIFVTSKTDWELKLSYDGETAEWASLTNYSGTGDSGAQLLTCKANPKETERAVTLTVYDKYGVASIDIFQKGTKRTSLQMCARVLPPHPQNGLNCPRRMHPTAWISIIIP